MSGITTRTGPAGFLVLGATSALFGLAFALIQVAMEEGSDVRLYMNLAWLTCVTVFIASFAAYLIGARQARSSGRLSTFDQQLQLRNFAIRSIPAGVVCVGLALVWYIGAGFQDDGWLQSGDGGRNSFIVNVFAGLGAAFSVVMIGLAVSFEKRAIRAAAEDIAGVAA